MSELSTTTRTAAGAAVTSGTSTRYRIRYQTTYHYHGVVPNSRHLLRIAPKDGPRQVVRRCELQLSPQPDELRAELDFFGNPQTWAALDQPHGRLEVSLLAEVDVWSAADPHAATNPDADAQPPAPSVAQIRDAALRWPDAGPTAPAHFMTGTALTPLIDDAYAYAAKHIDDAQSIVAATLKLATQIHQDFAYRPGSTDASTTATTVFRHKQGVCQDFAHVMLATLRAAGIPAAYVSGYLRTVPPPGQPRLEGADAMHAWVSVWAGPLLGWIGVDPTNAMLTNASHIEVAVGRDYADVTPINGVIVASGGHGYGGGVDVVEIPVVAD